MSDIVLTKDADAMICMLYKEYLERREDGQTIEQAKNLTDDIWIQANIIPKLPLDDVTELCRALDSKGLLSVFVADDHAYSVDFSDEGIIYMEHRFERKLQNVLGHIAQLKSIVPFL